MIYDIVCGVICDIVMLFMILFILLFVFGVGIRLPLQLVSLGTKSCWSIPLGFWEAVWFGLPQQD